MSGGETLPPKAWILEAGVERLDDVESLWRTMHEHHTEVAREVTRGCLPAGAGTFVRQALSH